MEQVHRHMASQINNTLLCGQKLHLTVLLDMRRHMAVNSFHINPCVWEILLTRSFHF